MSTIIVNGKPLDNSIVGTTITVEIQGDGFDSVSLSVDSGDYVELTTRPFVKTLTLSVDKHRVRARTRLKGKEVERLDAKFEVKSEVVPPVIPVPVDPTPPPIVPPVVPSKPATKAIRTAAELQDALHSAVPGDVIQLADGVYQQKSQFEATASGTSTAPIILVGSKNAKLTTGSNSNGGYGLHVTGSNWVLMGFTVYNSKKGIVTDGSLNTVVDGVEVHTIGQEGVHFRTGSANCILRNSVIHDTGLRSPQFGEGAYVGTAGGGDDSNNVLIENNYFYNIPAEGIDIKEGTYDGIIRNNRFDNAGWSGENSADSWIDIKGHRYLVEGNFGSHTLLDAIQVHNGGSDNIFKANVVEGGVPGVIVGIYPQPGTHGCIVYDDNRGVGVAAVSNIALTPAR